jgi:hypothetical protein
MKIQFIPTKEIGRDFPPTPAKKNIPDWYKNIPTEVGEKTAVWFQETQSKTNYTIRKCMPVLDFMTSGYTLKVQSDILVSAFFANESQELRWYHASSEPDTVTHHPHRQCPVKIQGEEKTYIKFRCGYIVKTPPGYSCMFLQSPYFMNEGIELFPAIVDTDTYDGEVLFPGFVTKNYSNLTIPAGTPLVTVLPFKREAWESEVLEEPSPAGGKKFTALSQTWMSDIYKNFFRQDKEYK